MRIKKIYKNLSDEELIELLKRGESLAFEELYNRYWSGLYSSAYNRVRFTEVAEEIVQDFFTSLWVNRESLNIRTAFIKYSSTAIRNLVFRYFQKQYTSKRYESTLKLSEEVDISTEQKIELDDLKRALEREVASLPPKCQDVYQLSRGEFKTNKEIAEIFHISEKTVENHLTRALKTLRLSVKEITSVLVVAVSAFFS